MSALEKRRLEAMSPQVKSNPMCFVSAVIERLPVVQPPLKSWEVDFAVVQGRAWDEIDSSIPPSIIKQQFEENPNWAVDTFKNYLGERADSLLPLVSPPKIEEQTAAQKTAAAAAAAAQPEQGKKGKKDKKAGKEAAKAAAATSAAPAPEAAASSGAQSDAAHPPGWQQAMADLGIEFAEEASEEDSASAMKLHVELKTKKDSKELDFQAAPRITEADKKNDTKSLERKLWNKLYLVVKRKGKWGFPRVTRTEKEGLLAAAKRAANTVLSEDRSSDLFFVSAAPMGYRPAETAKEFMLRAQLLHGGNIEKKLCSEPIEDYAWLTPKEIAELLVGTDATKDEYVYLVRMFGDDWWEDPFDAPEMSPAEDEQAKKALKQLDDQAIKQRVRDEDKRVELLRMKMGATNVKPGVKSISA